jgi:hypothetical protein
LLGFQDERAALVEGDPTAGDRAVTPRLFNHALEDVVVRLWVTRWIRRREIKSVAQLADEHERVGNRQFGLSLSSTP